MPTHRATDETAIREQAYYFWEQDGRPHGRETEYWMRAVVAHSETSQMDTLVKPAPKGAKASQKGETAKLKAAATSAKAAPSKAAKPAAKPRKK